ncbi:DNA-3-methyladenine glycosylase I [Lachnospiraceae bacterium 62-26]
MERCSWCLCNEKMIKYHDEEWGVPLYDDRKQFEFLMMEVMQCGLNWNMMVQKRGFKYLGSVTVYSHLQACGMINDHTEECFRYREVMEGKQAIRKRRNKES